MKKVAVLSAILPLLITSAAPAAAQPFPETASASTRSSAFLGARVRLGIGDSGSVKPIARLAVGTTYLGVASNGTPLNRPLASSTLELGLSPKGRPDFYMAGQRLSDVQHRLGFGPAGVALLALGGVALVAAAGGAAASSSKKDTPADGKNDGPKCLAIGICPP